MTNEERDLITRFIERVGGPAGPGGFSSVPATAGQASPSLPPIDREADGLLATLFQRYPEARYRITQLAVVQEQALASATQRLQAMQAEIQRLQQASGGGASPWNQGGQPQQSRGFFSSLFGGGGAAQPAPGYAPQPQPQYAPQYAQQGGFGGGMFQPRGSGFLGGALQTAAGVAGGVVAAEALTSLFSGHHEGGGMFGSNASFGESGASPWGGSAEPGFAAGPDPMDYGGAAKDAPVDNSAWSAPVSNPTPADSGWQDSSGGNDSGWTDSGGSDSGWTDSSSDS